MNLQIMKRDLFNAIDKKGRLEKQIILCLFDQDKESLNVINKLWNDIDYEINGRKIQLKKLIERNYSEKIQIEKRVDYLIETNCSDDLRVLLKRLDEINKDLEIL